MKPFKHPRQGSFFLVRVSACESENASTRGLPAEEELRRGVGQDGGLGA